ncbi:hypothetical protein AB0K68_18730 [Streptomyces sp. NPDC050698]
MCHLDHTDHIGSFYDPIVHRLLLNALDHSTATAPRAPHPPWVRGSRHGAVHQESANTTPAITRVDALA